MCKPYVLYVCGVMFYQVPISTTMLVYAPGLIYSICSLVWAVVASQKLYVFSYLCISEIQLTFLKRQ